MFALLVTISCFLGDVHQTSETPDLRCYGAGDAKSPASDNEQRSDDATSVAGFPGRLGGKTDPM